MADDSIARKLQDFDTETLKDFAYTFLYPNIEFCGQYGIIPWN